MFQKVFINPRIFQKPILGLTALLGFLVGRWLQIEKNESGDNSLSVFGAQLPRVGGDWSAAILLASEEEQAKQVTVQIVGLPPYEVLCTSYIITDHNNAFNLWTTMGKPLNPSKIQAEALMEASLLRTEPVPMFKKQGKANISLAMPSPGVVLLRLCSNSTAPPPQPYWLTALPDWGGGLFLSWRIPISSSCVTTYKVQFSRSLSSDRFVPVETGILTLRTVTILRWYHGLKDCIHSQGVKESMADFFGGNMIWKGEDYFLDLILRPLEGFYRVSAVTIGEVEGPPSIPIFHPATPSP